MRTIITVLFIFMYFLSYSQANNQPRESNDKINGFIIGIGANAVNSLGSRNPFYRPSDWSYKNGIALDFEQNWTGNFAIGGTVSYVLIEEGNRLDPLPEPDFGFVAPEDFDYFAFDIALKYYFQNHIFPELRRLELYGSAGFGMFSIENTNLSLNLGGGLLFWINKKRTFGLKAQLTGKLALLDTDSLFDNNHYIYTIQLVYRL